MDVLKWGVKVISNNPVVTGKGTKTSVGIFTFVYQLMVKDQGQDL